jgi:transcriptional regulator with XRE-family HTH domain
MEDDDDRTDELRSLGDALGAAISGARRRAGTRQVDLGPRIGVTQATVSRWEQGELPSLDQVVAIEDALGLARGELLVAAGYAPATAPLAEAIRADTTLADDIDREAMLELYRVLRTRTKPRTRVRRVTGYVGDEQISAHVEAKKPASADRKTTARPGRSA